MMKETFSYKLPAIFRKDYYRRDLYDVPNGARIITMNLLHRYVQNTKNIVVFRDYHKINFWIDTYNIQIGSEYIRFNNIDTNVKEDIIKKVENIIEVTFDIDDYQLLNRKYVVNYDGYYNMTTLRKMFDNKKNILKLNKYEVYRINYNTFRIDCFCKVIIKGRDCIVFKGNYADIYYAKQFVHMLLVIPHLLLLIQISNNMLVLDVVGIIIQKIYKLYDDILRVNLNW